MAKKDSHSLECQKIVNKFYRNIKRYKNMNKDRPCYYCNMVCSFCVGADTSCNIGICNLCMMEGYNGECTA